MKILRNLYLKFHFYLYNYIILPQIKIIFKLENLSEIYPDYLSNLSCIYETEKYIQENMKDAIRFINKFNLLDYALSKSSLDGLYLEFGVFQGTTVNHIAKNIKDNIIYGFDSFEGLPEDWRPGFEKGTFKMEKLPDVEPNAKLIKGYFDQSLPIFLDSNDLKICSFAHIDCDLYSSARTIFGFLSTYIQKGTVIVFDEYFNYPGWEQGEFKAFREFLEKNKLQYAYIGFVPTHQQVAVQIL